MLGDRTPRLAGRLTLNPLVHLDPLGLIMMLFAPIGWAKPVPINGGNFKRPRTGLILTAFAGPFSNLVLAVICFTILREWSIPTSSIQDFLHRLVSWGAYINVILFVFNLIPIPPLDGSRIVSNFLPYKQEMAYRKLDVYGPFILLLLFLIPPLNNLLMILFQYVTTLIAAVFGVVLVL
ncbi:site-2 protease family protein [Alicyclobacillus sp. SO9]|nr:site-2 protease family protein [Alicyclobacillus sp. SO9]